MKAVHIYHRGDLDISFGCDPGSHKGHIWDISANTETKKQQKYFLNGPVEEPLQVSMETALMREFIHLAEGAAFGKVSCPVAYTTDQGTTRREITAGQRLIHATLDKMIQEKRVASLGKRQGTQRFLKLG